MCGVFFGNHFFFLPFFPLVGLFAASASISKVLDSSLINSDSIQVYTCLASPRIAQISSTPSSDTVLWVMLYLASTVFEVMANFIASRTSSLSSNWQSAIHTEASVLVAASP